MESLLNSDKFSAVYGASGFPYWPARRSRNQLRKQCPFTPHRLAATGGSLKLLWKGLSSIIVFQSYEIKWILTQIKYCVNIDESEFRRTFIVFCRNYTLRIHLRIAVISSGRRITASGKWFSFDKPIKLSIIIINAEV